MFSNVFIYDVIGGGFMLDDFKDTQSVAYSLLVNSMHKNKLSHAYLVNANQSNEAYQFVMAFVKSIICKEHFTNRDCCGECSICNRIEHNNYPEVRIIETDTSIIKKEQMLDLQSEFSLSHVEGNYHIYIIKDCEKMNKQAANCLLKFLEEPVEGVIAILVTNHISRLLTTIVSRCQVIHLLNHGVLLGSNTLENFELLMQQKDSVFSLYNDEDKGRILKSVLEFLKNFETNRLDTFLYLKDLWYEKYQSKAEYEFAFLLMIYFYYDMLKAKLGMDDYFFCDEKSIIQTFAKTNSLDIIVQKIEIVTYGMDMVRCNLDTNLLIDDIVIRLGEIHG